MRFLVDESLSWRVAEGLAEAGHEAIHVGDLKLLGAADLRVMEAAASTDRVLIWVWLPWRDHILTCLPWSGS
jgi:predicted nuclease of predicted toxin-antitoxin system